MASRKRFVKLGTILTAVAAGLFFASGAFAASSATKKLGALTLQGVGTVTIASGACSKISCPVGDFCQCITASYAINGKPGFNGGNAVVTLLDDVSDTTGGSAPLCHTDTGTGTVFSKNQRNTITIDVSGVGCSTVDSGTGVFSLNATYVITGGSGKYSSATGAGVIGASLIEGTTTDISQASLTGSVQP